jgi:hypothetical protein
MFARNQPTNTRSEKRRFRAAWNKPGIQSISRSIETKNAFHLSYAKSPRNSGRRMDRL